MKNKQNLLILPRPAICLAQLSILPPHPTWTLSTLIHPLADSTKSLIQISYDIFRVFKPH